MLYYDEYDPEALEKIISTHKKVIEYQKSKKINVNYLVYSLLLMILQMTHGSAEIVNCFMRSLQGADIHRYPPLYQRNNLQPFTLSLELMPVSYMCLD